MYSSYFDNVKKRYEIYYRHLTLILVSTEELNNVLITINSVPQIHVFIMFMPLFLIKLGRCL